MLPPEAIYDCLQGRWKELVAKCRDTTGKVRRTTTFTNDQTRHWMLVSVDDVDGPDPRRFGVAGTR